MRGLIYAPLVHAEVDLGTMAAEVRRRFQATFGPDEWARRFASVEAMWDGLRAKLLALPLDWPRTRIYQDGLPVCGREREIVGELAAQGSPNHQVLTELVELGAILMGTEDPAAMLREYRRIQRLVHASRDGATVEHVEQLRREGQVLLRERDAYIAQRIDSTLEDGETGILFIGLAHRVDELLGGNLEVRHLIHGLPFGADLWRLGEERTHGD